MCHAHLSLKIRITNHLKFKNLVSHRVHTRHQQFEPRGWGYLITISPQESLKRLQNIVICFWRLKKASNLKILLVLVFEKTISFFCETKTKNYI